MNTYQVSLEKSYIVSVKADTARQAKDVAEFYTGDITDISRVEDRKSDKFSIEEIECAVNEARGVQQI